MPDVPGAANLLRTVGLLADGPIVWGRPIPVRGPGVFVVELPAPLPIGAPRADPHRQVDRARRDAPARWPSADLQGTGRPPVVVLVAVADRRVHRIDDDVDLGTAGGDGQDALGERRPSATGHWLHTPAIPRVGAGLVDADRGRRGVRGRPAVGVRREHPDAGPRAPRRPHGRPAVRQPASPTGERRATGLTGSLLPDPNETAPLPPTYVVQVADGDADGARGEPAVRRPKTAAETRRPQGCGRGRAGPADRPAPDAGRGRRPPGKAPPGRRAIRARSRST